MTNDDQHLIFPLLDRHWFGHQKIFRLRQEIRRNPRNRALGRYAVLHCPDWVNVVARTVDGRFVMIRQWRAGTDEITLEVPGGMGDPGEAPTAAGLRELLEETGYGGGTARLLGQVTPNPAFQTNRCSTIFVDGCEKVAEPTLDGGEAIDTLLMAGADVAAALRDGTIHHALVVAAFTHYMMAGEALD